MKISDRRTLEWWEAPGINGREDFDEEILYLGSLAEALQDVPKWAIAVRDLMPRWGFEPCAHRFPDGLEQVVTMIGLERAFPRIGGCGDVPFPIHRALEYWGRSLVRWSQRGRANGPLANLNGVSGCAHPEAALATGEAVLALSRGRTALDATLEDWIDRGKDPMTQSITDGDDAPLVRVLRHACCFNVFDNLAHLTRAFARGETPQVQVCSASLANVQRLDPDRGLWLRAMVRALGRWMEGRPPNDGFCASVHARLGSQDPLRGWLVGSLYKTLKLWAEFLDRECGRRPRYRSLV